MRVEILKFIELFKKKNGYCPNQSQIAKGLNTSRQRVNYHFKSMGEIIGIHPEYMRFFS